jgi:hypothetical protein
MRKIVLFLAAVMILFGLTGVLYPEALMALAKYSVTAKGIYVIAAVRIIIGALLLITAGATRMPKTLRVIGGIMLVAGVATLFMSPQQAQGFVEGILARGVEFFRVAACLPLIVGLLAGGAALTKPVSR